MRKFLLIDDHEVVRAGIKNVLLELFKPCIIYEANNEESSIKSLKQRNYDLILMDIQMPDTNSLGLMEHIKVHYPDARVLIFSMGAENIYAKRFIQAGAMGFISKNSGLSELTKAIDLVLKGRKYISNSLAEQFANELGGNSSATDNPFSKLSPREFEIVSLLTKGKTLSEISEYLNINTSTVGTHKARLFEKLNVKNIVELIEVGKLYNIE
ncbi:response regulator [Ferruginibacter albus]|uniref:response regulator n=1 Tax=Ferruginibacter albus TaxID=2875540 RepID=UPI001CC4EF2A|nr:response regulator transcription factor [Ferruginibacter albus]UAY52779.1 response regulator transcription factor [Ferruginibacter albus]